MNNITFIIGLISVGVLGIALGIALGLLLGRAGCIQFLSFIFQIPLLMFKSPQKIKSMWIMWQELKANRKIERMKKLQKIKDLEAKILQQNKAIKEVKKEINRLKCTE